MKNIILGIETSCDETSAALVEFEKGTVNILSNIILSQTELHKKYGGVVPEIAAREHVINILPVIQKALVDGGIEKKDASSKLHSIAFAVRPGLITSLLTGDITAHVLADCWGLPICEVDHIEAHVSANFYNNERLAQIKFPAVALTVSGGHTNLIYMESFEKFEIIGSTVDDAAGEAFDKAAKMMGLEYPGGPEISKLAKKFIGKTNLKLPRPMVNSKDFNFSFSGFKTAFLYALQKDENWKTKIEEYSWAAEDAITDVLLKKTVKAANALNVQSVLLAGGVSANGALREKFNNYFLKLNIPVYFPPLSLCTDNAAMVAIRAGIENKLF